MSSISELVNALAVDRRRYVDELANSLPKMFARQERRLERQFARIDAERQEHFIRHAKKAVGIVFAARNGTPEKESDE
jgi:hypothetical protein